MSMLLLAENDARLGQIVRRKLHRDFITGNDADEMLAHFAGNMREYVALPGQIDSKHRSGQHLGYRSFHYDLFFFRHRAKYIRQNATLNPRQERSSILTNVFEGN